MKNTYLELNAQTNLLDKEGKTQFDKDKEATRAYFIEHVNPNTMFFHDHEEKINYMVENGYWDDKILSQYTMSELVGFFEYAYSFKYRFDSFVGAYKFYTSYAAKLRDGSRYLERFEDRVVMTALHIAVSHKEYVAPFIRIIMRGEFQPATPTFLNAGRKNVGELVSCFLLRVEDNMESIGYAIRSSLQLSKRGGGVALLLSNLREAGAPIKGVENAASGVLPVMKILEDCFSYANQLGARQGAGAVYLHAHHPDIMQFLDTKRENADEKIRIKTLSLGVVVPDITMELARKGSDMYLFSPYDVEREYGKTFADISMTEYYERLVENPNVRKTKISARKLLQTIAELQFESGYPYIMFEDNVNKANPISGHINMSNLCSEILQVNTPTTFRPNSEIQVSGTDISCNLGSLNIAKVMERPEDLGVVVNAATAFLTFVSELSDLASVPSIRYGNATSTAIGLGQMNLHGYLAQQGIEYGSPEALEFFEAYLREVRYHALSASNDFAYFTKIPFAGFHESAYAEGTALEQYFEPYTVSDSTKKLFGGYDFTDTEDWYELSEDIQEHGLYNAYLLAIPPTGNISYVNGATPSIHPVTSEVEIRKEGKMGRVYYPAPGITEENKAYYKDAYEVGVDKLLDTYEVANRHTDQGCSMTLFMSDEATTRDLVKAYLSAWSKGIKTIYYLRVRQQALTGTEVNDCVSCTL